MINEQNGTLVANTVATVIFANISEGEIEVINRDGTSEIWYTDDGTTPTVAGTNCYLLPPNSASKTTPKTEAANAGVTIKLISSGTPKYAVEAVNVSD